MSISLDKYRIVAGLDFNLGTVHDRCRIGRSESLRTKKLAASEVGSSRDKSTVSPALVAFAWTPVGLPLVLSTDLALQSFVKFFA